MLRIPYFILVLISCAVLYGCATIMHGSTQDVNIIMPKGTQVFDAFGNNPMLVYSQGGNIALQLKRNKDYSLRFVYKGQEVTTYLTSSLEPGWLLADLFTYFIGYLVDGLTGAWNAFDDPIAIRFPSDTTLAATYVQPTVEVIDEYSSAKTGVVVSGNLGLVFPMEEFLATSYGIAVGYEAFPKFTFLLAYQGGTGVTILSQYSNYFGYGSYDHLNLECRFKAQGNLYLTAGGGISNITSDSLELDRSTYSDSLGRVIDSPIRSAPANKWMPTLFAGIGILGSVGFVELRHTFGLSAIPLSNGETGHFETTSLTFGVNLRF